MLSSIFYVERGGTVKEEELVVKDLKIVLISNALSLFCSPFWPQDRGPYHHASQSPDSSLAVYKHFPMLDIHETSVSSVIWPQH